MKKAVSVFMALLIVFSAVAVGVSATNGRKSDDEAYELWSEIITFDADYIEIGKEITATVDFDGDITYEWYVDGVKIYNEGNTFTPTEYDVEKIVTLKVYDSQGEYLGSRSICISKLPVVYVETVGRQDVVDKTEQDAYIKIQGNSQFKDSSVLYEGDTIIKGRGNTTLQDAKKPFKLKLGSKTDVFGMGKSKHWVLLSNPFDYSNIKNYVANSVAAEMGLDYEKSEPVTLVLNGKYAGTYYLCEHIRVDSGRVDITDWETVAEDAAKAIYKKNSDVITKDDRDVMIDKMTENMNWVTDDVVEYNGMTFTVSDYYTVPDINGGYLLELDNGSNFKSNHGILLGVDTPEGIGRGMFDCIMGYYQAFEDALYSDDFCTEYNGETMRYTDFIDVDSFVKGILLNEFACNADFGLRSTYMYKDVDGLLTYGPVWDFDLAFGRINPNKELDTFSTDAWKSLQRSFIARFCSDPYFLNELRNTYWEYRYTAIADMFKEGGLIDTEYEKIKEAAYENEETWSYAESFDNSIKILKRWTSLRADWLDAQFKDLATLQSSMSKYASTAHSVDEYVSAGDEVERLEIVTCPSKTDYAPLDEIDLSGLELIAHYADGTTAAVEPTGVVSYAKDIFGARKTYVGIVSDENASDFYVSLKYKNASIDYKINVSPKEDYEAVEKLIDKCPCTEGFNDRYLKEIFEAQAAYDSLSDSAKEKVSNYERLEQAMNCVAAMSAASTSGIVGAYISDYNMTGSKRDFVFVLKPNSKEPRHIIGVLPNGSTITYSLNKNIKFATKVNGYIVWTLWANAQDFGSKVKYSNGKSAANTYAFNNSEYTANQTDFGKITYTSFVNYGENATVNFESGPLVEKVIIKENGNVVAESTECENGSFNAEVPFDSCGEHSVDIWFVSGGNELYYDSFPILVREAEPEPAPEPTGVIKNVTYEASAHIEKLYSVTIYGRVFKIQFVDESGNTVTFSRSRIPDKITSFNSEGEECSDIARDLEYEVWNINVKLQPGHYVVRAKTSDKDWEDMADGYGIDVVNSTEHTDVISITPAADTVVPGDTLPVSVVTGKDILKIQITVDDAQDGITTFASSTLLDDGTRLFNASVKVYTYGEHTLRVKVKTADGWLPVDADGVSAVITGVKA